MSPAQADTWRSQFGETAACRRVIVATARDNPTKLTVFVGVSTFLVASIAMPRERRSGTLERLPALPATQLGVLPGYAAGVTEDNATCRPAGVDDLRLCHRCTASRLLEVEVARGQTTSASNPSVLRGERCSTRRTGAGARVEDLLAGSDRGASAR